MFKDTYNKLKTQVDNLELEKKKSAIGTGVGSAGFIAGTAILVVLLYKAKIWQAKDKNTALNILKDLLTKNPLFIVGIIMAAVGAAVLLAGIAGLIMNSREASKNPPLGTLNTGAEQSTAVDSSATSIAPPASTITDNASLASGDVTETEASGNQESKWSQIPGKKTKAAAIVGGTSFITGALAVVGLLHKAGFFNAKNATEQLNILKGLLKNPLFITALVAVGAGIVALLGASVGAIVNKYQHSKNTLPASGQDKDSDTPGEQQPSIEEQPSKDSIPNTIRGDAVKSTEAVQGKGIPGKISTTRIPTPASKSPPKDGSQPKHGELTKKARKPSDIASSSGFSGTSTLDEDFSQASLSGQTGKLSAAEWREIMGDSVKKPSESHQRIQKNSEAILHEDASVFPSLSRSTSAVPSISTSTSRVNKAGSSSQSSGKTNLFPLTQNATDTLGNASQDRPQATSSTPMPQPATGTLPSITDFSAGGSGTSPSTATGDPFSSLVDFAKEQLSGSNALDLSTPVPTPFTRSKTPNTSSQGIGGHILQDDDEINSNTTRIVLDLNPNEAAASLLNPPAASYKNPDIAILPFSSSPNTSFVSQGSGTMNHTIGNESSGHLTFRSFESIDLSTSQTNGEAVTETAHAADSPTPEKTSPELNEGEQPPVEVPQKAPAVADAPKPTLWQKAGDALDNLFKKKQPPASAASSDSISSASTTPVPSRPVSPGSTDSQSSAKQNTAAEQENDVEVGEEAMQDNLLAPRTNVSDSIIELGTKTETPSKT